MPIKRFADLATSQTPAEKMPDPDLGYDMIPAQRYTSRAFKDLEWSKLWGKVWLMGAAESDLKKPGDFIQTSIGNENILITKDAEDNYHAMYNVCSHRGNALTHASSGNVISFKCSYHHWEYDMGGNIINVPDLETFPQGVPCEKLRVQQLPCDTWGGWVWFSLDPEVEPLLDYLGMIPQHLDPYQFENMHLVNDITVEWECNWKTSVDAFNETYHVVGTHPQLMGMLEDLDVQIDCYDKHNRYLVPFATASSHLADRDQMTPELASYMKLRGVDPEGYENNALQVRRAVQEFRRQNDKSMGFDFSRLNDDQLSDDYHYLIFPNITMNIHDDSVMVFRQRPHETDPNKMYFDVQNYQLVANGTPAPPRPQHRQWQQDDDSLGEVLDQDAANLPWVQKGMNSTGFRGLWIGDQELRIRHFHDSLDKFLYPQGKTDQDL